MCISIVGLSVVLGNTLWNVHHHNHVLPYQLIWPSQAKLIREVVNSSIDGDRERMVEATNNNSGCLNQIEPTAKQISIALKDVTGEFNIFFEGFESSKTIGPTETITVEIQSYQEPYLHISTLLTTTYSTWGRRYVCGLSILSIHSMK